MKISLLSLLFVVIIAASILVTAWLFMLGIGGLHDWIGQVPTVGYAAAIAIVAAARALAVPFEVKARR